MTRIVVGDTRQLLQLGEVGTIHLLALETMISIVQFAEQASSFEE